MGTASSTKTYSPEDLELMPDAVAYELNDAGELVERAMGAKSSGIGITIATLFRNFVSLTGLGQILGSDVGLKLWPETPRRFRRPDVAFLSFARWPGELPEGYLEVAPELIVEVVSRRDVAEDLAEKATQYFAAGVQLVWIVYPRTRAVLVLRTGTAASWLSGDDPISGEDVLPGFEATVSDFFA